MAYPIDYVDIRQGVDTGATANIKIKTPFGQTAEHLEDIDTRATNVEKVVQSEQALKLQGALPTIDLNIDGGASAVININDIGTGNNTVSIVYDGTQGTLSLKTRDRLTDLVTTELTMQPDGSLSNPTAPLVALLDYTVLTKAMLEARLNSFTYDYDIAGIQDTGNPIILETTTYTTITELDPGELRDVGTYELKINNSFQYDTTGRSAYFQMSIDGGVTFQPFSRKEPKDATDLLKASIDLPVEWNGGQPHIIIQARCESSSDKLTINYASIVFERKL